MNRRLLYDLGVGGIVFLAFCLSATARDDGPGALFASDASADDRGVPVLVTEPASYDFGEILSGQVLDRKITLRNAGNADLFVKRIDFTCGCTIPRIILSNGQEVIPKHEDTASFVTLKPGEWAELKLEFQSLGRVGEVKHRMDILTNDPDGQMRHIPIKALVKRAFRLDPLSADFGQVHKGDRAERKIRVIPDGVGAFTITGIKNLPPYFEYSVEREAEGEPKASVITLVYKGPADVGKYGPRLEVQVENDRVRDFALFTSLRVVPAVYFLHEGKRIHDTIDLGLLTRGEDRVLMIEIENGDPNRPYRILNCRCKSNTRPEVGATLITERYGAKYKVKLTIPGDITAGRLVRGNIQLTSDHPELPMAIIRFRGLFPKK